MYRLIRPLLFHLEAEKAHHFSLAALKIAYQLKASSLFVRKPTQLPTQFCGLQFPNPVGLAAGLDKNGEYLNALSALGFGFVEIGTTTPKPQNGNPSPRLFRLPEYQAIINRLGFNNTGVDVLIRNVEKAQFTGMLGINIGKNKHTPNEHAADDYLFCLERVYPHASYITINISSPNTQGLRQLQNEEMLKELIDKLRNRQEQLAAQHRKYTPILIKISPDLIEREMDEIAKVALNAHIDGLICTNTTIGREQIRDHQLANQEGGLSGKPLQTLATKTLVEMANRLADRIPLIGVGGIMDGNSATEKIAAGAALVQVYTGLIYRGPKLIHECVEAIRTFHANQSDSLIYG